MATDEAGAGAGPEGRIPLSVTWREWLARTGWKAGTDAPESFDAIVVGSGYGGSVAALRLAENGWRTLLLERGSEYLPGDFPNDFSLVPKAVRVNMPGHAVPLGRASGLLEMHVGLGMVAVTGNGLGGGSLVNAGVVIEPDPDVFSQDAWPAAIRQSEGGGLQPFFEQARGELGVHEWVSGLPGGRSLNKTIALQRFGAGVDATAKTLQVTIDPARCVRCGDCASGCNVPGAKKTLASTYLAKAMATGLVQIVTQAEVHRFEREGRNGGDPWWKVHVFSTDAQHQFMAPREVFADGQPSATHRTISAPMLVLCAGTLGTSQLMQRSQVRSEGDLRLRFSPLLGTRVSGNGDSISWLVDEPEVVASLGRGRAGVQEWERSRTHPDDYDPAGIVGPTITTAVDLRDRSKPLDERLLVEDGAVPRAIANVYRELLATAHGLRQLDAWWPRTLRHPGAAQEDPLAASEGRAQQAQVLLVMGHDGSPARLVWQDADDRAAPWLPDPQDLETYKRQQALFDPFGDRHVDNPLWRALPRSAEKLMSGPKPPQTVTTVHPLGGCVMGDSPAQGVVDDRGRVWVHDPGQFAGEEGLGTDGDPKAANTDEPHYYPGLSILDGSIVPTSLGCNPLLTITALAERALQDIPRKSGGTPTNHRGQARQPQALPSAEVPIQATLNEVLLARSFDASGALARLLGASTGSGRFEARFLSADLAGGMAAARHAMLAEATLWLGPLPQDGEPAQASATYKSTDGRFEALPANAWSSGPAHLVLAIAQGVLVLAALAASVACLVFAWRAMPVPWWLGLAVALGLSLFGLLVVLPFTRSFLTWFALRGRLDFLEKWREKGAVKNGLPWFVSLLRQMVHAADKRVMTYRIEMRLEPGPQTGDLPDRVTFLATKRVVYRASIRQYLAWLLGFTRVRDDGTREPVPVRPTVWEQVMDADARLVGPGGQLLAGKFRMGFENLTSSGLSSARRSARGALELGPNGDTTTGMVVGAGYPLLFIRQMLRTRLLDFRLPSYSKSPRPDVAPAAETDLRGRTGRPVVPVLHWLDGVPRGSSNSDRGDDKTSPLRLQLWQYRQQDEDGNAVPPQVVRGTWMGVPVARAKAVLLLHAFGQSGLSFTFKTESVQENLAEHFHRQGYEVWILETRMSTRSGYAKDACTVDQIADNDIPRAVERILSQLATELPAANGDGHHVQISAFAQCIGSAALWMALLSGRLSHGVPIPSGSSGRAAPQLSKLSHAVFSQVHPWVVGGKATQAKTWMPALLQAVWGRGAVPFAVRGPQDGLFWNVMDRLFASMPAPDAEAAEGYRADDGVATCRRIRFIEAPLFRHQNLGPQTLAQMNLLFGDANLRLFAHARRFVDRERLVDEDGTNRYVTDANVQSHLAFPIQLLHGEDNELFDVASVRQSFRRLRDFHPDWQAAFCVEPGKDGPGPLLAAGYGHLDVLIGEHAAKDVFGRVSAFFRHCLEQTTHAVPLDPPAGWVARAPRLGPFVGWLRQEAGATVVRVSFALDDNATGERRAACPPVILRRWCPDRQIFVQWPVGGGGWQLHEAETGNLTDFASAGRRVAWRFAWADIRLPADGLAAGRWQVLSLHPSWYHDHRAGFELLPPRPSDEQVDGFVDAMTQDGPESIVPPLTLGPHDFTRAEFRLPPAALDSLPPGNELTFAAGCCRYPGLGIDRSRVDQALDAFFGDVQKDEVAFAMLVGDQIYADATAGLVDPSSPLERYYERHANAFDRDGLGRLLAALPVYMTPDDHEWIDNYPSASPLVKERWPDWRSPRQFGQRQRRAFRIAAKAITAFQRLSGPLANRPRAHYQFDHGCTQFYVLDTRFSRQRNEPRILRDRSMAKLRAWLQDNRDDPRLKVIASGSVVLPGLRPEADPASPGAIDTWQYAEAQRRELLAMLVDEAPGKFLLLSGDYHVSGAVLVRSDGETVGAAIVVPPLYAPLPYANATPESVHVGERIQLASGKVVDMEAVAEGEFTRGSGLATISVLCVDDCFSLAYRRKLWVWEEGKGRELACVLPLGMGCPPVAEPLSAHSAT